MEINDIIRLMEAVSENSLTSFKLEEGDIKLSIKKEKEIQKVEYSGMTTAFAAVPTVAGTQPAAAGGTPEVRETAIASDKVVSSPLVGTFYASPSPDADNFVNVGDAVRKGQVLGIIEAMKLMNEIECEYDGVVEAILVNNEDVVEYGQPLFRIH